MTRYIAAFYITSCELQGLSWTVLATRRLHCCTIMFPGFM